MMGHQIILFELFQSDHMWDYHVAPKHDGGGCCSAVAPAEVGVEGWSAVVPLEDGGGTWSAVDSTWRWWWRLEWLVH